ncbi:MAG: SRPBCC family protein [Opitutae bacterium]|nr:SRPBCC family protein [Opitutae bacterium]
MKILLKILGGLAVLVLLLVVAAFFLPRQYRVQRSVVINAKPDAVLAQIAVLRAWKGWSAWHERDPHMKLAYSDQTAGVGSWASWESKNEGNGKMTITELTPTRVLYLLEFPDYDMKSTGTMELIPEGNGVRLVWSDVGELGMNPMNRWFGLLLDKFIGRDFERGLANLKRKLET